MLYTLAKAEFIYYKQRAAIGSWLSLSKRAPPTEMQNIPVPGGKWGDFEREYRLIAYLQDGRADTKVFRAVKRTDATMVAIKVSSHCDQDQKQRYHSEAYMLAVYRHPRIVQYVGHVEDETRFAIAMELCAGDLYDTIIMRGPNPPYITLRNEFTQIVLAVQYLHSYGIAHLDIKPENVLRSPRGWVLADFEFARSFADGERLMTAQGTIYYAAPELVQGTPFAVEMAPIDVYAMGVMLYVMCTEDFPFPGNELQEIAEKIRLGAYEIPTWVAPDLARTISWCMQMNPGMRPTADLLAVEYLGL